MTDHSPVHELGDEQCWELLRRLEFGRMAYLLNGKAHLVPINYAVSGTAVLFMTGAGSKLLGVTEHDDVAFEVDEVVDELASSVILRGKARELIGEEISQIEQLRLRPWVDTEKVHVIAIDVKQITGRSFELSRPWMHMMPHGR